MNKSLPPPILARTWLDLQNNEDVSLVIKLKRLKLIEHYFNIFELTSLYVDMHHYGFKQAKGYAKRSAKR